MSKHVHKAGDLVRVAGRLHKGAYGHSLPQGSVCEVKGYNALGNVELKHPKLAYHQGVHPCCVKPAKQAMRKRDAYANRRG